MTHFQSISVTCPACKSPFVTQVYHIVDVGSEPQLKWQLLAGKLNVAKCPSCQMAGILGMPFAYHDAEKQLLFIFMPAEAGLSASDQEILTGNLVREVMNGLPPEKRKGYLFQPKTFLRLDSLLDAILEADGITKEMLEAQRKRSRLINEMLAAGEDTEKLKTLFEAHRDEIDYEFYQTLTATAEAAGESGDTAFADALLALRGRLLKLQQPAREPPPAPAERAFEEGLTRDALLERLLKAKDDHEFEALTAVGRPLIDYTFYLNLANRIEAAEKEGRPEEAQQLTTLRNRLLDVTKRLDEEMEAALKSAGQLLREIYDSEEPAKLIEERIEQIDDLFFYVVTANIEQASRQNTPEGTKTVARLKEIATLAADAIERRMPPRLRLINRLLRAETDEERKRIVDEEKSWVDAELGRLLDTLINQFDKAGQPDMVKRLTALREWTNPS